METQFAKGATLLKGKVTDVSAVSYVGDNQTALQTITLFVPGYHDGFEQKGRDQYWQLQALGQKVADLNMSPALKDKIIEVKCYLDSQYIEPKESGQKGFFSVNATIKEFTVIK